METVSVEFKVSQNEKYGDYRVDEYFNGTWNNQRDNGWTEKEANNIKKRLDTALVKLNGDMIAPATAITVIDVA
ncbi:hypothetical protein L1267_23045 [Pseudoalteromonas sp. OFAV1]|uniref:hypothetical protein n=1 Tax=Pseudoalteromonas sp. OFAV1 TaxID=2908892 RepID=UPI001F247180|nr:hypothetical protein [Pseudoalteromonas sp. OFAV1]MCF2903249.1 hypothetical protein [Pseudoalteromonas sp. OFAV1]